MNETTGYKKIIRYKVKADKAQENIDYIHAIFKTLERSKPDRLRFAVFQLEDGVSFLHIAFVETEDGSNPLHHLDEFKAFANDISARCEEPPTFSMVKAIGAYRLFG